MMRDTILILYGSAHVSLSNCVKLLYHLISNKLLAITILTKALCSQVKGFRPHGLLVYRLCLPPDTPIIFIAAAGVYVLMI